MVKVRSRFARGTVYSKFVPALYSQRASNLVHVLFILLFESCNRGLAGFVKYSLLSVLGKNIIVSSIVRALINVQNFENLAVKNFFPGHCFLPYVVRVVKTNIFKFHSILTYYT